MPIKPMPAGQALDRFGFFPTRIGKAADMPSAGQVATHQSRTASQPSVRASGLTPKEKVGPVRDAVIDVPITGGIVNLDLFARQIHARRAQEAAIKDQIADAIRRN